MRRTVRPGASVADGEGTNGVGPNYRTRRTRWGQSDPCLRPYPGYYCAETVRGGAAGSVRTAFAGDRWTKLGDLFDSVTLGSIGICSNPIRGPAARNGYFRSTLTTLLTAHLRKPGQASSRLARPLGLSAVEVH